MSRPRWIELLAVVVSAFVTVWGLGSFGIWDPWELGSGWATAVVFELFGVSERSARLINAIGGLAAGALTFALVRREVGTRAAVIAVATLASTPLFLLNARLSMGDAPGMAAQAWVLITAVALRSATSLRWLSLSLFAASVATSIGMSGVLLGPLPPVLAITALGVLSEREGIAPIARWLMPVTACVMLVGVARAVSIDAPEPSLWLGGGAVGGDPPTWDEVFELVFHGFAPWSAALPVAAMWLLRPEESRTPRKQQFAWILLLWIAFAFASWTLFASRYGTPPFLAAPALAGLVATWLSEADRDHADRWAASVVIVLLTGLLIRDYALYPDSPLEVLAAEAPTIPDVYRPIAAWSATFLVSGGTLCLLLVSGGATHRPDPRKTVSWLRAQAKAGWPRRGWTLLGVSLLGACVAFGAMCFVLDMHIASIVVRGGRAAFFAPLLVGMIVFGTPWVRYGYHQLGRLRVFPVLVSGLAVGGFVAFSFLPTLSGHFSPKPVYETYELLTDGQAQPLAAHRVSTAAARYYTGTPIRTIDDRATLLSFLREGGQRWAIIPADQLASLDLIQRRETGAHLYVADARSARLLLLAAQSIEGRPNQSFIPEVVLSEPPVPSYEAKATYDDRIALLGYDLALPEGDSVGAGQRFSVTWYWKVIDKPPPGYEIFVHIDGEGLRFNGDHVPVGGRYPTTVWEEGDIIADRQELVVPANFRSGDYVIYVGWYKGGERLPVGSGPNDGEDRVHAGVLAVR